MNRGQGFERKEGVYISFYLAGDIVHVVREEYLPNPIDIENKKRDLAGLLDVDVSLIYYHKYRVEKQEKKDFIDELLDGEGITRPE